MAASVDLSTLDEAALYDHLRTVWERARAADSEAAADPETAFRDEPGQVNLLGGRGLKDGRPVEKNTNTAWDDTLYVIWKEGERKRVRAFAYSSEYGATAKHDGKLATALLVCGFHKYKLGFHKKKKTHKSLKDAAKYPGKDAKYRALNPFAGVKVWRDTERNLERDAGERLQESNSTINVHYGGEKSSGPSNWSAGCQVVKGWADYKELIRLVESDASIKGSIDNELAEKPARDGTRPLIYLLLPGAEVASGAGPGDLSLPLDLGHGVEVTEESIAGAYRHTEQETPHGFFPLGENTTWHGGVHLYGKEGDLVRACLDGELVCARLGPTSETGAGAYGSRNFVLLRHEIPGALLNAIHARGQAGEGEPFSSSGTKTCYSLLMHLAVRPLDPGDESLGRFAWLRGGEPTHFAIRDYLNFREGVGTEAKKICTLAPGDRVEILSSKPQRRGTYDWYQVRGEEVARKEGRGREGWIAKVAKCVHPLADGLDAALLERLGSGEVVPVGRAVKAGDPLWEIGRYWGEAEEGLGPPLVHWGIFSEELLFPSFETAEDTDRDFTMDCERLLEMVDQEFFGLDSVLTAGEIRDFYAGDPGAKRLRTTACRFVSEWGADVEAAVKELAGLKGWLSYGMADRIRPYCFWPEAQRQGVALPDPLLWHYNPIAVLELFAAAGEAPSPSGVESAPAGDAEEEVSEVLAAARRLRDGRFSGWTYGSDAEKQQINCVQYVGAVLEEVGVEVQGALRKRLYVSDIGADELQDLVEAKDSKTKGVQQALVDAGLGEVVDVEDVEPGDLIQYWYGKPGSRRGHASVIDTVERTGDRIRVEILGAHKSVGGVGLRSLTLRPAGNKVLYLVRYTG
ncbi:MAG: SH3 domain-containing protein [Planctomycetota bacterium]|nr:MAG: SH3 domain-containing protein [Planctomycetota bacterium]